MFSSMKFSLRINFLGTIYAGVIYANPKLKVSILFQFICKLFYFVFTCEMFFLHFPSFLLLGEIAFYVCQIGSWVIRFGGYLVGEVR
jgi:hypothetical protein